MAKGILEFDLNDPDDVTAHKRAVIALDLCFALFDIEQHLRTQTKYNENLTQEAHDALYKVREEYYSILSKHDISLDDLIN